jgi:glutaredoxin-like protein NrdH
MEISKVVERFNMLVTVYSLDNCIQCRSTCLFLDKYGIEYTLLDVKKDPNAASILGKHNLQTAPIVTVSNDDGTENVWCGFRIDKIKELADAVAVSN